MTQAILVLLVASTLNTYVPNAISQENPGTQIPQAAPVIQMIKAIETNDPEMLIDSFSERAQEEHKIYKKEELLALYISSFEEMQWYPVKAEDFTFTYEEVDTEFGLVQFHYKDDRITDANLRVKKEKGVWKLAEK